VVLYLGAGFEPGKGAGKHGVFPWRKLSKPRVSREARQRRRSIPTSSAFAVTCFGPILVWATGLGQLSD